MNWLRSRIARSPKRALVLGKAVFLAGCILVLGAVFARASLSNLNSVRVEGKLPALHTLAEAYPQSPTWLVPEGVAGFSIAGALVLVGMLVTVLAEEARKRR
jgi:hypothetical protein